VMNGRCYHRIQHLARCGQVVETVLKCALS
jgi:hypothetical protein